MIVEERTYSLRPGTLPKYLADYAQAGLAIQSRHLGPPWGYFVVDIGPLNQVVHLWRYSDHEDRSRRRAALSKDDEWLAVAARLAAMIERMESRLLVPAPFMAFDDRPQPDPES